MTSRGIQMNESWHPDEQHGRERRFCDVGCKVYELSRNLLGRKHEPVLSDERCLDVIDAMIAATKASPDPTMDVNDVKRLLEDIPSRLVLERADVLKDAGVNVSICDLCMNGADAANEQRGWLGVVELAASVLEHGLATWDSEHRRLVFPECAMCLWRQRCDNHRVHKSFGGYMPE